MKTLLSTIAVALSIIIFTTPPIFAKKDKGFVSLFNGKNLKGWKTPSGEHAWKVIDGVIDYEAKGGPFAFLVAKMLNGQLRKGFTGFIHQLEPAAQQRTASS